MRVSLKRVLRVGFACPNCGCRRPVVEWLWRFDGKNKADCFDCLLEVDISEIKADFRKKAVRL